MPYRHETVVVVTAQHRITGSITLARDGYRSRVSDVLNAGEREFVSLTDALVERLDGSEEARRHPFVTINRHQIVFALLPDGEDDTPPDAP
ncbi:hypothetical protein GKE82_09855 [Conexibacter sp. W3-3-2]|uniref:Uncharacterized protein n=1 Tax=Paraconexibacter algicola TaxID=2133960 RepID=A0A2T4UGI6_9ACTN|nr:MULTISPECIES: hypothetical protein [Solirubrobacterales]MTD44585.1 hypothetical protein [Conexibacter sp. W3-3-2]PTL58327.1 hypothetical protein C7Y72_01010 [Paraconexibacter algicola]